MQVLDAPAKLTLSLRITGRRADGYHLIDAEMVSLDLHDTVAIGPGSGLEVRSAGTAARSPLAFQVPMGADNLVTRALRLVRRRAHVQLTKRIPAGAGLGGGSADAAAILRWAGVTDPVVAASLGADVAFCLRNGRARVGGIGEVVEPLVPQPKRFTLLTPPLRCSTVEVYRAWDGLGGPVGPAGNDLEAAALAVEPRLARYRDQLAEVSGQRPRLAGSGSTWFVEGAFPGPDLMVVNTTGASW